jgi:hypothetical protein
MIEEIVRKEPTAEDRQRMGKAMPVMITQFGISGSFVVLELTDILLNPDSKEIELGKVPVCIALTIEDFKKVAEVALRDIEIGPGGLN